MKHEIKDYIRHFGISGLEQKFKESLENYKTQPIKLALTGATGTGKSTLINTLRGLRPKDKGAARVDVTETTKDVKAYQHQDLPNYKLYDVPGVNTPNFPKATYIDKINLFSYDCIIICAKDRFTENDLWLAQQATKKNIPCVFARTQVNKNLESAKYDEADDFDEDETLRQMRTEIEKHLSHHNLPKEAIFLISGRLDHTGMWDHPNMIKHLKEHLPGEAEEAFIMSLKASSKDAILMIRDQLEKRITNVATYAAISEGLSGAGKSYLEAEYKLYRTHFGLDHDGLPSHHSKDFATGLTVKTALGAAGYALMGPFLGLLMLGNTLVSGITSYEPFKQTLLRDLNACNNEVLSKISQDTNSVRSQVPKRDEF